MVENTLNTVQNGLTDFGFTGVDITKMKELLNPKILTPDSIQGVIVLCMTLYVIFRLTKHIRDGLIWSLCLIILCQIGHVVFTMTVVGDAVPFLKELFKYDVLTSIAQLCVGTKLCDILLWMQAWINWLFTNIVGAFILAWNTVGKWCVEIIRQTLQTVHNSGPAGRAG